MHIDIGIYNPASFQKWGVRSIFVRDGDVRLDMMWLNITSLTRSHDEDMNFDFVKPLSSINNKDYVHVDVLGKDPTLGSIKARSIDGDMKCLNLDVVWPNEVLVISEVVNNNQDMMRTGQEPVYQGVPNSKPSSRSKPPSRRTFGFSFVPECNDRLTVYLSHGRQLRGREMIVMVNHQIFYFPSNMMIIRRPENKKCVEEEVILYDA
jgi:hypothetical protein